MFHKLNSLEELSQSSKVIFKDFSKDKTHGISKNFYKNHLKTKFKIIEVEKQEELVRKKLKIKRNFNRKLSFDVSWITNNKLKLTIFLIRKKIAKARFYIIFFQGEKIRILLSATFLQHQETCHM